MLMKIAGAIRGAFAPDYPEGAEDKQLQLNNRGELVVAQGLPDLAEIVRLGESYQIKTATAFAALTTEPTTTAALSLHNNEPGVGKCYVIESVAFWERVVDATQQNQIAIFGMVNPQGGTMPSAGTQLASATSIKSLSGRSAYGGKGVIRVGATVTDDGWFPYGNTNPNAAAVAGGAWRVHDIPLRGLVIVPPGAAFSVHAAKIAATASQLHAVIRWHEVQLLWKS